MDSRPLNGSSIIHANEAHVRCQCTVDLISRRQRPYRFRVKVWGEPPHEFTRIYEITAISEERAADRGLRMFEAEMSRPLAILATLQ